MSFCFKCPECFDQFEVHKRIAPKCYAHQTPALSVRDYKAEGVGLGTGVKVSRDGTVHDQAELFLPTNRELAGPGDPDGTKGMREWRERVKPKSSKPHWPGSVERKTF